MTGIAGDNWPILVATTILCLIVLALAAWRVRTLRQLLRDARAERDRAIAAEDVTTRTLRMAGAELRTAALSLLGQADRLRADPAVSRDDAASIHAVGAQIFGLADELQDHAVPTPESRVLHVEPLRLDEPVRDAIAAVAATLGPSRRLWTIDPDLAGVTILADRRALSQVFLRILGNAARFSRHDDRIAISLLRHVGDQKGEISVVVADAATVADAESGRRGPPADRGAVGLGLAMARILMQAHGGDLSVAAVPRFGTCVSIVLPAHRVSATQPLATT
jgi:two-component system cell cycle sensor histidine kinase PleC